MAEPKLSCPKCGTHIPDTGMRSRIGMGDTLQPASQHTTCPECGMKLVRNPDDHEYGLNEWRELEGASEGG